MDSKPIIIRSSRKGFFFLLLIAGGAAASSGWLWYQHDQQLRIDREREFRLSASEARVEKLSQELAEQQKQLGQEHGALEQLGATQQLITESFKADHKKRWQLAEVEYYTHLAERHLLLTHDVPGALALLETADSILADADDNSLLTVRRALSKDILALKAASKVDIPGLYLRLGAIADRIDNLSMPMLAGGRLHQGEPAKATPAPATPKQESTPAEAGWKQRVQELWAQGQEKFRTLVTVRHHDEPVKPLLDEQQRTYIRQNLHLFIQQAQLGLLRGEPEVYRKSVGSARDWLARYFQMGNATEYAAIQSELFSLLNTDIRPATPDLSGSLSAVRQALGKPATTPATRQVEAAR